MTMQDQKILNYLRGTVTAKDEKEVQEWITTSVENARRFNLIKAKHIASTLDGLNMDLDSSYYDIVKIKNPSSKNKGRVRLIILKTAAILVFFISSTYIFKDNIFYSGVESIIPEDAIILKLGDGNIEVIAEDGTAKVVDSEGNL